MYELHSNEETHVSLFSDVGSPAFEEFLETIGEKVALKGFDSFRGGLDNKSKYEKFLNEFNIFVFTFSYHQTLRLFLFIESMAAEKPSAFKYLVVHV